MEKIYPGKLFISGAPLIGEGNIIDSKAIISVFERAGMPAAGFYPNGLFVRLGRRFHVGMSMSTKKTVDYALISERSRNSIKVLSLKWELRLAVRKALKRHINAVCFITSQSIMAEESVGCIGDIPTIMCSSDVSGKLHRDSRLSERARKIIYMVWNREALHLYKNELNLKNVHLIKPVDPINAFQHIKKNELPFYKGLGEPNLCFIKLSGSGGDPGIINKAIISLWSKSGTRSVVFPGTEKTRKRIIKTADENIEVNSSLDPSVFYGLAREMISNEQMILVYPSEQVKHIAILTQKNVFPRVVWLPPRGQHEIINLAWAVKKGFSGTVCMPKAFQSHLNGRLIDLGISPSEIEFIEPDKLSAEHFKSSPLWHCESDADTLVNIVKKITDSG